MEFADGTAAALKTAVRSNWSVLPHIFLRNLSLSGYKVRGEPL